MRKIEKRSVFCLILAALLGIGLAFFCFRFVADGDDWASYPDNRHLYNNQGVLKGGTIIDSRGVVLSTLSEDGERVYNEDGTIRRATLHAVGDPAGNIGAGALTAFADKLSGYNLLTGAYSPIGTGNKMCIRDSCRAPSSHRLPSPPPSARSAAHLLRSACCSSRFPPLLAGISSVSRT